MAVVRDIVRHARRALRLLRQRVGHGGRQRGRRRGAAPRGGHAAEKRADGVYCPAGGGAPGSRALCHGAYRTVLLTNRQYIFERAAEGERVLVAVNAEGEPFDAHFDAGAGRAVDLVTGRPHDFGGGSRLAPYSAAYWRVE